MKNESSWKGDRNMDEIVNDDEWIKYFKEWFEDCMQKNKGEYSEALKVREDGHIDTKQRLDGGIPFLPLNFSEMKNTDDKIESRSLTIEGFYDLIHRLQSKIPDLDFNIEVDPRERRWIKYSVKKKPV